MATTSLLYEDVQLEEKRSATRKRRGKRRIYVRQEGRKLRISSAAVNCLLACAFHYSIYFATSRPSTQMRRHHSNPTPPTVVSPRFQAEIDVNHSSNADDQLNTLMQPDEEPRAPSSQTFNFDPTKYKDGTYRFIPASATDQIRYTGRVLKYGSESSIPAKINAVDFDWPGVSFEITVKGSSSVAIRLKGDGNYFNVFVDGQLECTLRASLHPTCCDVATDLSTDDEHTVSITKRTEPQVRGAMSTFKLCTFYGFIVEENAHVVPPVVDPDRCRIEFVGDASTCGLGNEGESGINRRRFGMKGRMENVYNAYPLIAARMLNAEAHVLGWSGKGVHSNAHVWGVTMPTLYKQTLALQEGEWDMMKWVPDVVVLNMGGNDLTPPASPEADVIEAYASFVEEIRDYRPNAHIFCVVCDEGCLSSDTSEVSRSRMSRQLREIVKVALARALPVDEKLHYTHIHIDGDLQNEDYVASGHYSVSGHVKIAGALAEEIARKTGWDIKEAPMTMPYPQAKKDILIPKEQCVIS